MSNSPVIPLPSDTPYRQRIQFDKVLRTNNRFLQQLEHYSDEVLQYEDRKLQAAGLALIPVDELTERAQEKFVKIQQEQNNKSSNEESTEPCIRDLILVELVNWFNTEFMTWVNKLHCRICDRDDIHMQPTRYEQDMRVEVGFCCRTETKFYRYNDVAQLLVSRSGRCGEYANCFTFFCRCMDFDSRLVHAFFDHVWTEVYSKSQARWVHVDPSDNVVDSPLMYEHGWKRSIDYVFAVSKDDLQDVTWRYTSNHRETLKKRNKCDELFLVRAIQMLRKKRQRGYSPQHKRFLDARCLAELIEMTVERAPTESEKQGRSSGSLAWREARGEVSYNNKFVFTPNSIEIKNKQLNVRYSCATDQYQRYIRTADQTEKTVITVYNTWQNGHFTSKNINRKVEHDWKMVYLARTEEAETAEISWCFDFTTTSLRVHSMSMKFDTKTYANGEIVVTVDSDVASNCTGNDMAGASMFQIKAKLFGGEGNTAWQHTQLFRQPLNSDDFPFEVQVVLM